MATVVVTADKVQAIQPGLQTILTTPPVNNLVPPDNTPVLTAVQTINGDITSLAAANTPGGTPLPTPPDNFHFFDGSVQVGGTIPGDAFKGTTPGITAQFIDLTPDNIGITGLKPNLLMATDTGNDVLLANGGRNILAGGAGTDTFVGGTGTGSIDTFLGDASKGLVSDTIFNFHSGDNAAILGLGLADYQFSLSDTTSGLQISASPVTPGHNLATMTLAGFTTNDIGTRLTLGLNASGATPGGSPYLFVHGV